jgi:hypothetical protein
MKLQEHLRVQSNPEFRNVYHVGTDRYYVKLPGMSLDDPRNLAVQLLRLLKGNYRVDVRCLSLASPSYPMNCLCCKM